jgi:hypothetical protein
LEFAYRLVKLLAPACVFEAAFELAPLASKSKSTIAIPVSLLCSFVMGRLNDRSADPLLDVVNGNQD